MKIYSLILKRKKKHGWDTRSSFIMDTIWREMKVACGQKLQGGYNSNINADRRVGLTSSAAFLWEEHWLIVRPPEGKQNRVPAGRTAEPR